VYQAGTLSGNPVAMTAGIAQVSTCLTPGFYEDQEKRTRYFVDIINNYAKSKKIAFELVTIGSIFWLTFGVHDAIKRADEIDPATMLDFKKMYSVLLENGIYIGPSGYEVGFISTAHTYEILDEATRRFCNVLDTFAQ
jgi:glutamate-1-semialdehyde 2,1-aminomutase